MNMERLGNWHEQLKTAISSDEHSSYGFYQGNRSLSKPQKLDLQQVQTIYNIK